MSKRDCDLVAFKSGSQCLLIINCQSLDTHSLIQNETSLCTENVRKHQIYKYSVYEYQSTMLNSIRSRTVSVTRMANNFLHLQPFGV